MDRAERAIVDLTIRCVDRIRSWRLARMVMSIVIKLRLAMMSPVKRMVRTLGPLLAKGIARIARGWGNKSASSWALDPGFIQYLMIIKMNDNPYLGDRGLTAWKLTGRGAWKVEVF